jgi:hypothetical protein
VAALRTALTNNRALHVTLLLDYLRGTRNTAQHGTQSSVTLLLPLVQAFPDRVRPLFRSLFRSLFRRSRASSSTRPSSTDCSSVCCRSAGTK